MAIPDCVARDTAALAAAVAAWGSEEGVGQTRKIEMRILQTVVDTNYQEAALVIKPLLNQQYRR